MDQEGEVVDVFLQNRRDGKAAKRLLNTHAAAYNLFNLRQVETAVIWFQQTPLPIGKLLVTRRASSGYARKNYSVLQHIQVQSPLLYFDSCAASFPISGLAIKLTDRRKDR